MDEKCSEDGVKIIMWKGHFLTWNINIFKCSYFRVDKAKIFSKDQYLLAIGLMKSKLVFDGI